MGWERLEAWLVGGRSSSSALRTFGLVVFVLQRRWRERRAAGAKGRGPRVHRADGGVPRIGAGARASRMGAGRERDRRVLGRAHRRARDPCRAAALRQRALRRRAGGAPRRGARAALDAAGGVAPVEARRWNREIGRSGDLSAGPRRSAVIAAWSGAQSLFVQKYCASPNVANITGFCVHRRPTSTREPRGDRRRQRRKPIPDEMATSAFSVSP